MDDVRDTLNKLNAAWREHRFDELALFFDENVIMKGPAFKGAIESDGIRGVEPPNRALR